MKIDRHLSHRRRFVVVSALLTTLLVAGIARSDNVAFDSSYCDGQAYAASGEGSLAQATVHSDVFAPAFAAACPSEAGLVSYLGTGDAAGIQALRSRTRHFAGTDVPLSTAEKAQMEAVLGRTSLVHQIPLYIDGFAVAYNVPCTSTPLKIRSSVLSLIYSGVITNWNDRLLALDNPVLASCNLSIRLTKREAGAGATAVFQDYLSKRNPHWIPYRRGVAGQPWPTLNFACTGLGDEGMVSCVANRTGAIGYVRMANATASGLPVALVENSTASFVAPSSSGCMAAADAAVIPPGVNSYSAPPSIEGIPSATPPWPATLGDWSAVSMTDAPDAPLKGKSYPICTFSYALILQGWYGGYGGTVSGKVTRSVVDYFTVALRDSTQDQMTAAGLAPLPPKIRQISREAVSSISLFNFTPLGF